MADGRSRVTFSVSGAREISAGLRALGDQETIRRLAGGALERAAEPIRDDARTRAPKLSGALRESIQIGLRKAGKRFNGGDRVTRWVGINGRVKQNSSAKRKRTRRGRRASVNNGVAAYAIFTEFGAPGHNVPAQPYLRPAWEANKQAAYERLVIELRRGIDVMARRAARASAGTMVGHNGGPTLGDDA